MKKKNNYYKLKLQATQLKNEVEGELPILELAFENHDNIFGIIERTIPKQLFSSDEETAEFVIGLKLFSEVVLRHKDNPFFEKIKPAIAAFMKKLKSA